MLLRVLEAWEGSVWYISISYTSKHYSLHRVLLVYTCPLPLYANIPLILARMKIKDLLVGQHTGPLAATVEDASRVHNQLLRVTLKDESGRVNLIIEGSVLCHSFESLKRETSVELCNFEVSAEVERFQKYFPPMIRPNGIAEHGTNKSMFIIATAMQRPDLRLTYWKAEVTVLGSVPADSVDIKRLYARVEPPAPRPAALGSVSPTQDQYSSLSQIRAQAEGGLLASVYCIVLDCTGSYSVSNSTDVLMLLKVTDESLFPEHANIQIFHQPANAVPKVVAYGDVLRVQSCMFKIFKGVLTGTLSAQSKAGRLMLFSLDSEDLTPYGVYKGTFSKQIEHHKAMLELRRWAKPTLAGVDPPVLSSSITLSKAQNSECDVLARVYAHHTVGTEDSDPVILFLYDAERTASLVLDRSREKMTRWLAPGDTVRVRSVCFEENRLIPSCYTDIFKIPSFIERRQLPEVQHQEEALAQTVAFFLPHQGPALISSLRPDLKTARICAFPEVAQLSAGEKARTKGHVVSIVPNSPAEVRGYFCGQCRQFTHQDVCPCGRETDVRCQVSLVLWDGKSDRESDLLRVVIREKQLGEFLNSVEWREAKERLLSPETLLEVALEREDGALVVLGTSLRD